VTVGVVDLLLETAFTTEMLLWILLSVIALLAWKKWFREETVSTIGQSKHSFDTLGTSASWYGSA